MTTADRGGGGFWAITSYYNPVGYGRRRENFRNFRDNLNVPLVAVELAFDNDFDLADGDADTVIRLRGGDVMWQKERLLNLALKAVPSACRKIAWLDADVIFGRDDWADARRRSWTGSPWCSPSVLFITCRRTFPWRRSVPGQRT